MTNDEKVYEMHRKLCEDIEDKIAGDIHIATNTICKVEKSKVVTFDEALRSAGMKISISEKGREQMEEKWERGLPIYIPGRAVDIPRKGETSDIIKCDINKIKDVRDITEEINRLESIRNSIRCRK